MAQVEPGGVGSPPSNVDVNWDRLTAEERGQLDALFARVQIAPDGTVNLDSLSHDELCVLVDLLASAGVRPEARVAPTTPEPPPIERAVGALHKLRAHGVPTLLPSWRVVARMKPLGRDGTRFRVLCGRPHPCPARLGEASMPNGREASRVHWLATHLEAETYGPQQQYTPVRKGSWIVTAPPEFPGFERVADGSFRVIRTSRVRDRDGQYVRRTMGRREVPSLLYSEASPRGTLDVRRGQRGIVGWFPRLPAVLWCPTCGLTNLVEDPEDDEFRATFFLGR